MGRKRSRQGQLFLFFAPFKRKAVGDRINKTALWLRGIAGVFIFFSPLNVFALSTGSLTLNELRLNQNPYHVSRKQLVEVVRRVSKWLEWDIRQVEVFWHQNQAAFLRTHSLGPSVVAVTLKEKNQIHLGPKVNKENLPRILGHELVHVVLYQKYKSAIPIWLEEGLANFISGYGKVDYRKIQKEKMPIDIRKMGHPFITQVQAESGAQISSAMQYQLSTALIEMLASRCDLHDLLQLSVGENLERYLGTFCEISDLNIEFRAWIQKKKGTL